MKHFSIIVVLIIIQALQYSCKKPTLEPGFEDTEQYSIYNYLVQNEEEFSDFLTILKIADLDMTLSGYNPHGIDYTLFAPDNKAIEEFLNTSNKTLDDILNDSAYVYTLARYHVVNQGVSTYEFPFGTFSEPTLSGDFLNVNFILAEDTTYYKINNLSPVSEANIKMSNGYIHVISTMLNPITMNSYNWLKNNPAFSIITEAIEITGYNLKIDVDMKLEDQTLRPFTILAEPDSVFNKKNVYGIEDLIRMISPDESNYIDSSNSLNLFVGYHMLNESKFLNDLEGNVTNYNTFADVPLSINGAGLDIIINPGKEVFDTVIFNQDSTIVDYIGFYYDASNIITQSGAIHLIDQILRPQIPSKAIVLFEFLEEIQLQEYSRKSGSYLIEDEKMLDFVNWSGADLYYYKSYDESERASNKDYLQIEGNFTISYTVPKIVQGKFDVFLGADSFGEQNAIVELFMDGIKLGGIIDLTKGGYSTNPYLQIKVGSADFKKYDAHTVTIKSLIPGRFKWDYIRFEPI
jgi:uncharacterized surface protein with fasciclin (FAS1) repeats